MSRPSDNPVDRARREARQMYRALHPGPDRTDLTAALGALVVIPRKRARLDQDELDAIDAALDAGATWTQIGEVLGLGSRQAARQHGDRLRQRLEPAEAEGQDDEPGPVDQNPAPALERRQPKRRSRKDRRR